MKIISKGKIEGLNVVEEENFIEHKVATSMEYVLLLEQNSAYREVGSSYCDSVSWDEDEKILVVERKAGQWHTHTLIEIPSNEISHLELWSNGYHPTYYVGIVLKKEV